MDWLLAGWAYWSALAGSPELWGGNHDDAAPRAAVGADPELTALDLRLIEIVYAVVAAESRCTRCGAPLGRGLRVRSPAVGHRGGTASIVTRCAGWRHHRLEATAGEASNDLALGPFRAD